MPNPQYPLTWQRLFRSLSRKAYERIEAHNLQYPTAEEQKRFKKKYPELSKLPSYSIAYPKRIKESEEKTILNVLKQWTKQTANKIQTGETIISNIVSTNRKSARNFKRSARGSNQHFAKGVFCGCLIGEADTITNEYKCQFTFSEGKGVGVKAWKQFHGTQQDFELCIHHDLIPTHLFPEGINFEAFDPYALEPEKKYVATAITLASKEQKMPLFPDWIETLNKEISQEGDLSDEGNSKKVASFAKLYLDGQVLEAYARLLMDSYKQKLAKAMNRSFSPAELKRGKKSALSLLKACNTIALDGFVDKCLRTITHMEQWILHDPSKNFVMPPSKWFDMGYSHNIAGAYRKFLLPWDQQAHAWKQKELIPASRPTLPQEAFGQLAQLFWKHLSPLHPKDQRVRKANLSKWAYELQLLHKESRLGKDTLQSLILWLVKSPSKRAKFWRKESGGFGIRSASGFRRNFTHLHAQMMQDQAYKKS
ncbi:MAG: hypothetical protein AAFR87_32060 [Bacteroidota bacterium]